MCSVDKVGAIHQLECSCTYLECVCLCYECVQLCYGIWDGATTALTTSCGLLFISYYVRYKDPRVLLLFQELF